MKVRQRVRAPSRPTGKWPRFQSVLKSIATGRNIKGLILVLIGAYFLISLAQWYAAVNFYGDVGVSDTRSNVRYALGAPAKGGDASPNWTYPIEAGAELTVSFDAAGNVTRISCVSPNAEPNSCPELYGLGIGAEEGDVGHALGNPDSVRIEGDKKFVTYHSLGATYVMQRFIVTGLVRDSQDGSFMGKTWKFLRSLVPLPGWIG